MIWHKFKTSQVVIAADAEAIAFRNKNFKFCLFIYLLVRIVADVETHVRIRALTSQHLEPLLAATKLNRFFSLNSANLLFSMWHFGVRTHYAYAFHLPPSPPPPHHIQRDKFLNDHKNRKSIIAAHSCRARLYSRAFVAQE